MKQNLPDKNIKPCSNQDGIAIVTAIFSLLLATVIALALYYSSNVAISVAKNERDNTEAFYLAEAGYSHALALLGKVQRTQFTTVLSRGDGQPDTGDELSAPPINGLWTNAQSIPAGNVNGGGITNFGADGTGRYFVQIKNDTALGETPLTDLNGTLIITSTGVGRDGSTATVECTVNLTIKYPAVIVNGNLRISGNFAVEGLNGSLHANGNLSIKGNPCADRYFSASGIITDPSGLKGSGCIGVGETRNSQPNISFTSFNISSDFKSKADYVFGVSGTRAGRVYDKTGKMLVNAAAEKKNTWVKGSMEWEWNPTYMAWFLKSTDVESGTYYSEGNLAITGTFGSPLLPKRFTAIAEGAIYNQGGKQYISPALQNYSLIAGTDIALNGRLTTTTDEFEGEGLVYAGHQIEFVGTPTIHGTVIAANLADTLSPGGFNLVPLAADGFMDIKGNPKIISNNSVDSTGIKTISWREVRR